MIPAAKISSRVSRDHADICGKNICWRWAEDEPAGSWFGWRAAQVVSGRPPN